MRTWLLSLLLLVGVVALAGETTEMKTRDELQPLSGRLREALKSEFKYYLEIEGMTENMNLTGDKSQRPDSDLITKQLIEMRRITR